jgi:hypothetical protein
MEFGVTVICPYGKKICTVPLMWSGKYVKLLLINGKILTRNQKGKNKNNATENSLREYSLFAVHITLFCTVHPGIHQRGNFP